MEKTSLKAQLKEHDPHHIQYRSSMDHNIDRKEPKDWDSRLF